MVRWEDFFKRFTTDEAAAITASTDPVIKDWIEMWGKPHRPCHMGATLFAAAADKLVELNILTADRKTAVFVD